MNGGDWKILDDFGMSTAPSLFKGKVQSFNEGRFGFYLPGNDEVEISNFSHYAREGKRTTSSLWVSLIPQFKSTAKLSSSMPQAQALCVQNAIDFIDLAGNISVNVPGKFTLQRRG